MNSTNHSTIFGGKWTQITDRFLYCANSSKETSGNKTITVDNLPAHTHTATWKDNIYDLWHETYGPIKDTVYIYYPSNTSDMWLDAEYLLSRIRIRVGVTNKSVNTYFIL